MHSLVCVVTQDVAIFVVLTRWAYMVALLCRLDVSAMLTDRNAALTSFRLPFVFLNSCALLPAGSNRVLIPLRWCNLYCCPNPDAFLTGLHCCARYIPMVY